MQMAQAADFQQSRDELTLEILCAAVVDVWAPENAGLSLRRSTFPTVWTLEPAAKLCNTGSTRRALIFLVSASLYMDEIA